MFEKVYQIVRQIPRGKVLTYGDIAHILQGQGYKVSARLVGFALHANKSSDNAPCHRVVNKKGRVAPAFAFGGDTVQRQLLEAEGVNFIDEFHVDLQSHKLQKL